LELSKTPKTKHLAEITKTIHSYVTEHKKRVMLMIKHVDSDSLEVLDIPSMIDLVKMLLGVEEDTKKYIKGTIMHVKEVNELVMCAKQMFCTLHNIQNFEIVTTNDEVTRFFQRLSQLST
jgi:hypothetical protein